MRYYAMYTENGDLMCIGEGPGGVEITKEEYIRLLTEINAKSEYINKIYIGEATLEDVPVEWRDEVQQAVDTLISDCGEYTPEISESEIAVNEALAILHGEVAE